MILVDFNNWKAGRVPGEINNFSALVFMLVAKADPVNREKLRNEWPAHVALWEEWQESPPQAPARETPKCPHCRADLKYGTLPQVCVVCGQEVEEALKGRRGWDG